MSQINGGRIVPILTGHDHPKLLDQPALLNSPISHSPISSSSPSSSQMVIVARSSKNNQTDTQPKGNGRSSLEMAALKERGLYALPTDGDGNCLYYSLSDQLYGDTSHADKIRQRLADHMATHKEYFMQFVSEGGERRRPRRAAASTYATRSADISAPSEQDKERRFEDMIAKSRTNFEWASSEHIQAFCQSYKLDVTVYTSDGVRPFQDVNAPRGESRNVVHVAFHDFKHYSSVRSIEGKHEGLFVKLELGTAQPFNDDVQSDVKSEAKAEIKAEVKSEVKPAHKDDDGPHPSLVSEEKIISVQPTPDTNLAVDVYAPWDINTIQEGLGGRYDRETIIDMLQKCRGDIDRAFAALLDEKDDAPVDKKSAPSIPVKPSLQASRDSSPFSTGSKRSADDSEESDDPRPARRVRPKRRILSNLTLGVDISFRDDQHELVSLNLRMNPNTEQGRATDPPLHTNSETEGHDTDSHLAGNTSPAQSDTEDKKCRRSRRLSRPRPM